MTIRPGWQPLPDADSSSPGWTLGRSSTSSPGFGSVLVVAGVPGVVGVVAGGGVDVVVGGVVLVVGGGVVVMLGLLGRVVAGGGVVVVGGGGVVVGVAVTVNRLLAVSGCLVRALVQVPVTG
ncbi:hypothetical protein QRX60_21680 [Amycolatopsis mongoliensis]|uniref:Uncharacterized protein n=1 Tax=Amycolatopsis mongoliensis TaxID=715475 RepID=A0A9Y2JZU0_9PSEU|nr:hypothetical protein [Amycolatopsis sp. 4-36]WIY06327.1 hypothetical protein QRX60_21680 [Amycolatopsis sp. 4-36]